MAERIQLRRKKGWRKPPAAVVISRPSRWGNPYRIGVDGTREAVIARYREDLVTGRLRFGVDDVRRELAGKDLACWCPPEEACHGDVLLEIANRR